MHRLHSNVGDNPLGAPGACQAACEVECMQAGGRWFEGGSWIFW
jgi:hypothetical protein